MKDLLSYIIKNITGTESFEVSEQDQDGRISLTVVADPTIVGLIIGKEGKTIKNIRRILAVRATLDRKTVNISVNPNS